MDTLFESALNAAALRPTKETMKPRTQAELDAQAKLDAIYEQHPNLKKYLEQAFYCDYYNGKSKSFSVHRAFGSGNGPEAAAEQQYSQDCQREEERSRPHHYKERS